MINKFVLRIGAEIVVLAMTLVYLGIVATGTLLAPVVLIGMRIHELVFRKERRIMDEFARKLQRRRDGNCCDECRLKSQRNM